jgi:hypothetical protein
MTHSLYLILLLPLSLLLLLQVCVAEHVRNRGAAAVMDKTRDADLIQLLLEQRRQLDEVSNR